MRTQESAAAEALALAEDDCIEGLAAHLLRDSTYPNRQEARRAVNRGELLRRGDSGLSPGMGRGAIASPARSYAVALGAIDPTSGRRGGADSSRRRFAYPDRRACLG